MNSKLVSLLVLSLIVTVAASGCRKRPGYLTTLPNGQPVPVSDAGPSGALGKSDTGADMKATDTTGISQNDPEKHKGWIENADILKAESIHFAFDRSEILSSDKPHVAAVADYLKGHPEAAVHVEGNCDERGTEEYNRSLGDRRAIAAREELVRLGIDPGRVDTMSNGEDKPVATGHDDAAWKQNRRDDFIVLTPPNK